LIAFSQQGKWIAAICAAPSILGKLGILKDEKATCYPGFESYLEGAIIGEQDIIVSNRIITGKGPGVAIKFGLTILEQFYERSEVEALRQGMIVSKYT
jgi:4-methyl-5(b-hydroxyethyl)-thiazole monophosphate biosynthesis